ncbi:MAG: hypothetical protein V2I43_27360 [Parvularcula sp.]|nr:hypothetical protein [Parvularcula sp.]
MLNRESAKQGPKAAWDRPEPWLGRGSIRGNLFMFELAAAAPPQVTITEEWEDTVERAHYSPAVRVGT